MSRLCLPASLSEEEVEALDRIVRRSRPLHKGDYLFRADDPMRQVFVLRSGALKSYLLDANGDEQVTGFVLPGEMLGLDAIGETRFCGYAVALETSLACAMDLEQLEDLSGRIPGLRHQLLHILSRGIHGEHEHIRRSRERAEQRLASFLLGLSMRYRQRGLSPDRFTLPMTRGEIGNYLDLTVETVSRLFTRYIQAGLIECHGREVRLLDRSGLCRMGGLEEHQEASTSRR
ncbi:fumarate/nitrate reduction transcriptional regulator Fnr [Pseudomonas citronellolis]|uniref:fumarate/nitrate reduction transcriptional regulator Fnr n=1 Tax=Pseudomonas citronellolis TaxID=53408 RepID=UPI0021BE391A|nr:fumarate/nitrate reduction transcriptional regulator Fnr [Pseudomonas citronellolis]UXJ50250.1 fumarate/nitrate reduction transcriptional regulator Fnr [Pseudomonas citronellolis]